VPILRGVSLLYRRNKTAGAWGVRDTRNGADWTERLGTADDFDEGDGKNVLTYWQARDLARERLRGGKPTSDLSIQARVARYKAPRASAVSSHDEQDGADSIERLRLRTP